MTRVNRNASKVRTIKANPDTIATDGIDAAIQQATEMEAAEVTETPSRPVSARLAAAMAAAAAKVPQRSIVREKRARCTLTKAEAQSLKAAGWSIPFADADADWKPEKKVRFNVTKNTQVYLTLIEMISDDEGLTMAEIADTLEAYGLIAPDSHSPVLQQVANRTGCTVTQRGHRFALGPLTT